MATERLRHALSQGVDPAGFVVFRLAFGLLAAFTAIRFVGSGWVEELLLDPSYHFAWIPGLEVPPAPVVYGLFAAQILAGLLIAIGRHARPALVVWLVSFGVVELFDKALYLNHYVLMTLLGVWLLVSPVHRVSLSSGRLPAWSLWLLRVQVATVYAWAGVAKLNADWLLRAEPLTTWLQALVEVPLVGPLLAHDTTAYLMSWGGAAYDLMIPALLLAVPTRRLALALVAGFHVTVGVLFPIGVFPLVMLAAATLFLDPAWPRRFLAMPADRGQPAPLRPIGAWAWITVLALITFFPARSLLFPGNASWHERGHRFAWRVLLNEKTGLVDYRVVDTQGRTWRVQPAGELTDLQHEQLRTQPDLIRQYALHLEERFAEHGDVAVYADAFASLNGRPSQRLIDPAVDLTGPLPAGWVVPLRR